MKNTKLQRDNILILVAFVFLGFFIGGDVALLLYPMLNKPLGLPFALLFFFDNLFSIGLIVLIAYLFGERSRLLQEQASTKEYFQNEHFVYTETALRKELDKRRKKRNFHGCIAALGIKNLNSEILSLYGANAVKEINELVFLSIYQKWANEKDYLYAYNILDDFLIYKETADPISFYKELTDLAKDINAKIQENGALPASKILLGAYQCQASDTTEQMIQRASFAEKYNAATRLSDEVVVFSKDMVGEGESQRDLSYELTRALDEGQFEIYYQPKFDLKNEKFFGAEALIRWNHPIRGVLPPSLFIPFAEQTGRIIEIDRYVFRHVCMDIARWEKEGRRLLKISVNLSRKSVYDPSIFDYFVKTTEEFKVNPLLIEIELTESVAAKDTIFTAAMIRHLKEMGFGSAIDDFGVGYSSFSALKKTPFDTLKVDKSFIDDIEIDKKARDMVQCVIQIGHALDMSVIAEGVQNQKQVEILKGMGLNSIQGFFFSRALPSYEYEKFLEGNPFEKAREEKK
jgi:EAL domain-containing protein (putative c-di-GMP-specific phosphodiesterase class I)